MFIAIGFIYIRWQFPQSDRPFKIVETDQVIEEPRIKKKKLIATSIEVYRPDIRAGKWDGKKGRHECQLLSEQCPDHKIKASVVTP